MGDSTSTIQVELWLDHTKEECCSEVEVMASLPRMGEQQMRVEGDGSIQQILWV
jgi:hypothetical protein